MAKKKETLLTVDGITVSVERKCIKSIRLRVCPPYGQVKLSAPLLTGDAVLRRFISDRADWIRDSQRSIIARSAVQMTSADDGGTFLLWGESYRLRVTEQGARYKLIFSGGEALFTVPCNSTEERRKAYLNEFYRGELTRKAEQLFPVWENETGLKASGFSVRDMTSRWGSCNTRTRHILLNLELAKKPPACLGYVILHELAHLKVAGHNADFYAILDAHMPGWKRLKKALNSADSKP